MPPKRSYDVKFKLGVVEYAREHSEEQTMRKYGVDPKRVRKWRKQYESLNVLKIDQGEKRKRLQGGGCKKVNNEFEELILKLIIEQRRKCVRVSKKMIEELNENEVAVSDDDDQK